jgi:hypothetical protein
MQDRILKMFEDQEQEQKELAALEIPLEFESDPQQETLEGFPAADIKKTRKSRAMSDATRYVLRTNGLLQQRVMIEYTLRQNSRKFEEAVHANDEFEMRKYEHYIQSNTADIQRYENIIQDQLRLAEQLGYVIEQNPLTGRFVIVSGPSEEHTPPVSISAQTRATIEEYFTALKEFETAALEFLQEEFKTAVAENRFEQAGEFSTQMREIKARIDQITKHREGLLKLFV